MANIRELIQKTWGKDNGKGKMPAPYPTKKPRGVGDISIAIKAQQIYNPQAPPAPPMGAAGPKAPPKAEIERGVASNMDLKTDFLGKK